MKNIFKLSAYEFDGEYATAHISTDLSKEDFEKLLIKLNTEAKKDEDLISSGSIFSQIVKDLKKNGCEEVYFYSEEYFLDDDCPLANSTFWTQLEKTRKTLGE